MVRDKFEELTVGGETARMYTSGIGNAAPRVVVFHPWWGLNDDVIAYANRLAGEGFAVVAPDLVRGRVASTIEDAERLASGVDEAHADAVALATLDWLTRNEANAKIGTVGFSFGAALGDVVRGASPVGRGLGRLLRLAWRPEAANLAFERTVTFLRKHCNP